MTVLTAEFETLRYEKDPATGVAELVLCRPSVLNALNMQMRDDLWAVLRAVRTDSEVRTLLLRGEGKGFCAGADLKEFGLFPSVVIARAVRRLRDNWALLASLRQPVVAAVHGFAIGAGLELVGYCDLRLASPEARFGLPETTLGMVPAAGGSQTQLRATRGGVALDMLLTGRYLPAAEAQATGLINTILPQDELLPAARALAARLASLPPAAVQAAKAAVQQGLDLDLARGLTLEQRLARLVRVESTGGASSP